MEKEKFIKAYLNARPLPIDDIMEARRLESKRSSMAAKIAFPGGTIDDITADTGQGLTRLRIYTPPGSGPFPVILYMHGGGFSIGSPDTSENLCRAIAKTAGAVLISVDYGLAPEHKFPFALEECYRAALWIDDNDVALNVRSDQLAIAGDSAGGNLAAGLCLLARERQDFTPIYQVLICPLLDQRTRYETKVEALREGLLSVRNSATFSRYYLNSPAQEANLPLASPLLAESFSGLPPATIISAELDPLAAEAGLYAERLKHAGTRVIHRHYAGQVHDFVLFVKSLDEAAQAAAAIGLDLANAFAGVSN